MCLSFRRRNPPTRPLAPSSPKSAYDNPFVRIKTPMRGMSAPSVLQTLDAEALRAASDAAQHHFDDGDARVGMSVTSLFPPMCVWLPARKR